LCIFSFCVKLNAYCLPDDDDDARRPIFYSFSVYRSLSCTKVEKKIFSVFFAAVKKTEHTLVRFFLELGDRLIAEEFLLKIILTSTMENFGVSFGV
jgi:hypothetical protein